MISVVVRILNERENLRKLLDALKTQKCSIPFEIIVVDNESTDGTKELALSYGVKIVTLARNDFSYPKAMNLGIRNCSGEYVVLTVGHALPFSNNWLETVIENFKDKKNAGIYGGQKPRTNADPLEFITYGYWYLRDILKGKRLVKKGPGILGATNCAIRKSLWEKHYFNEYYECGGEDGEWAKWAIKEGLSLIHI